MPEPNKRMLFVDDELAILQGLERMLFDMAEQWDMVFVETPELALRALNEARFDVIVSDVRMPGMDGATLLAHVRDQHPDVVRILLTGYSEREATLRAMPVAHHFLTKPCKSTVLVDVLRRSCALSTLLDQGELRGLVGAVSELPARPETHAQLAEAVADPDVDAAAIATIVSRDVALSSKILHLTNSAFFGARRSFSTIHQAVMFIGVRMLRELVLSTQVFGAFKPDTTLPGFSLEAEQRHALACAGIARAVAGDSEQADTAFLAGMLHDVGKLIWATHAPALALRLVGERTPGMSLTPDVEERLSGTMHGRIGAYLLGLWGMDEPLVEAVAYHHDPAILKAPSLDLPTIVHIADALAHEIENERTGRDVATMLDLTHLERLGVLGELDAWRELARELWNREVQ